MSHSAPLADDAGGDVRGRHIARSTLLVMGLFVAAKVVGLVRDRVIAHRFGVSEAYDAYVAAFRIPDLIFTLLAGGALISAFLPVFAAHLAAEDRAGAWRLASAVTNLVALSTAACAAAAAVWAGPLAAWVAPGFAPAQQALTADLMRGLLLSTLVFSVSGLQMGMLNAFQHFLTPALAPIVYNLGLVLGAVVLAPRHGIQGLVAGAVIGAVGHLAIKLPSLARRGARWSPVLGLGDAGTRRVLWLVWPRVLALGTVQAVFIVNTRLASAVGGGAVASLNYAWLIAQMPQTILGTAVGTVVFPTLAELAARRDGPGLRATTTGALRALALVSVPAAALLWALSAPIVAVILETGRFDAAAAAATSFALRGFAFGLVGHVAFEVVARLYYAQQDTLTPLWVASVAMALNVALAYALVGPLAQGGLALANSIAVTLEVALALRLLRRRLGAPDGRALGHALLRAALVGGGAAAAAHGALAALPAALAPGPLDGPLGAGLARLAIGGLAGTAAGLALLPLVARGELAAARRLVGRG